MYSITYIVSRKNILKFIIFVIEIGDENVFAGIAIVITLENEMSIKPYIFGLFCYLMSLIKN